MVDSDRAWYVTVKTCSNTIVILLIIMIGNDSNMNNPLFTDSSPSKQTGDTYWPELAWREYRETKKNQDRDDVILLCDSSTIALL